MYNPKKEGANISDGFKKAEKDAWYAGATQYLSCHRQFCFRPPPACHFQKLIKKPPSFDESFLYGINYLVEKFISLDGFARPVLVNSSIP